MVRDSILFENTCVGEGAVLDFVVADKSVKVGEGLKLSGCSTLPLYIGKGKSIKAVSQNNNYEVETGKYS